LGGRGRGVTTFLSQIEGPLASVLKSTIEHHKYISQKRSTLLIPILVEKQKLDGSRSFFIMQAMR